MSHCHALIGVCADRVASIRGVLGIYALAALAGCPLRGLAAEESVPSTGGIPSQWRTGPYCGVNAAYAFLKLAGRDDVSYDSVERQIPVCTAGSSLLQVKNCLRTHGINAVAVRVAPQELYRLPKPVIALFDPDEGLSFDDAARGHFVVVIAADPVMVRFIDATSVVIQTLPTDQFIRNWSGILVVAEDRRVDYYKLSLAIAASAAAGAFMPPVLRWLRNRTRRRVGCLASRSSPRGVL